MEEIIRKLSQRASEACYWKEDFENKGMVESADYWRSVEQLWLDAVAIVKGEK